MSSDEPRYLRLLRALLHLTEPDVQDGIILGVAVSLAAAVVVTLLITGN